MVTQVTKSELAGRALWTPAASTCFCCFCGFVPWATYPLSEEDVHPLKSKDNKNTLGDMALWVKMSSIAPRWELLPGIRLSLLMRLQMFRHHQKIEGARTARRAVVFKNLRWKSQASHFRGPWKDLAYLITGRSRRSCFRYPNYHILGHTQMTVSAEISAWNGPSQGGPWRQTQRTRRP